MDKNSLWPYFRYETQQANIVVSPLKCDPYDDSVTLNGLDNRLEELKNTRDAISNNTDRLDELNSKLEELNVS